MAVAFPLLLNQRTTELAEYGRSVHNLTAGSINSSIVYAGEFYIGGSVKKRDNPLVEVGLSAGDADLGHW